MMRRLAGSRAIIVASRWSVAVTTRTSAPWLPATSSSPVSGRSCMLKTLLYLSRKGLAAGGGRTQATKTRVGPLWLSTGPTVSGVHASKLTGEVGKHGGARFSTQFGNDPWHGGYRFRRGLRVKHNRVRTGIAGLCRVQAQAVGGSPASSRHAP